MINTLLGTKVGMTSSYDARGRRVGVTMVKIEPNFVTQIKTTETKDGYNAVQLAVGTKKSTHKPQIGHAKKAGLDSKVRFFREVRVKDPNVNIKDQNNLPVTSTDDIQLGQQIQIGQVFSVGDAVKVSSTSKGKGFAGGMKRHGFHGGPKTHGQSDRARAPGSIGSGTTPGRVYKGKKMAGHMGVDRVSYKNLEIVGVDKTNNLLVIKGGVPGHTGSLVIIEKLGRIKGYTPPPEEKEEEEEPNPSTESNSAGADAQDHGEPEESKMTDESKEPEVKEEVKEEGEK